MDPSEHDISVCGDYHTKAPDSWSHNTVPSAMLEIAIAQNFTSRSLRGIMYVSWRGP